MEKDTWFIEDWNIEEMTGYEPKTTFYTDFSIADRFGNEAIEDTYKRCMEAWKTDTVYLTELVMVLNWKIWRWYTVDEQRARLYDKLWGKAKRYAETHLKGDGLTYYFTTVD